MKVNVLAMKKMFEVIEKQVDSAFLEVIRNGIEFEGFIQAMSLRNESVWIKRVVPSVTPPPDPIAAIVVECKRVNDPFLTKMWVYISLENKIKILSKYHEQQKN